VARRDGFRDAKPMLLDCGFRRSREASATCRLAAFKLHAFFKSMLKGDIGAGAIASTRHCREKSPLRLVEFAYHAYNFAIIEDRESAGYYLDVSHGRYSFLGHRLLRCANR
jgi:hypothetical protein